MLRNKARRPHPHPTPAVASQTPPFGHRHGPSARALFNVFIVFIQQEPTCGWRNPKWWGELVDGGDRSWDKGEFVPKLAWGRWWLLLAS